MAPIRFPAPTRLGLLALLASPGVAGAQQATARMSVDSSGVEGEADSTSASLSSDGRHVAFESEASNLVANDTNDRRDVFVRDRDPDGNGIFDEGNGVTTRVSVSSAGVEGDGISGAPSISADGRFVAFESLAQNLVSGDTNGTRDIFVVDRDPDGNGIFDEGNGVTIELSVAQSGGPANGESRAPSTSSDGRYVAFNSGASNLVANDTNSRRDVFVRDRDPDGNGIFDEGNDVTLLMSLGILGRQGNGISVDLKISASGRHVAFDSIANNLVVQDRNGDYDVFVRDRDPDGNGIFDEGNDATVRMSVDSSGHEGNQDSLLGSISGNGRHVTFYSSSDNLVPNDTNGTPDVFVRDRDPDGNGIFDEGNGVTTIVSVDSAGMPGNGYSYFGALSGDGRLIAFESGSTDLVPSDTNGNTWDIFVRDRDPDGNGVFDEGNDVTSVASVNSCGIEGGIGSYDPAISADGRFVGFESASTGLVSDDANGSIDVFVRDLLAPPPPNASWSNYGAGYPGTLGVPGLTSRANPVLGTSLTIDIGNSQGRWSVGFLLAGLSQASIPTNAGGTLLIGRQILWAPFPLAPFNSPIQDDIPNDPALCGLPVFLQTLELDPGAQYGLSFTPGLELDLGH